MHWRLRHPKHGDDQLSNPLRPLAAAAAAPGDDRQAAHHQGAACRGKGYGLSLSGPPSSKGPTWRHEAQSSTPESRREEARLSFLPTVRSIRAGMGRRRRLRSRVSTCTAGPAANCGPRRNRVTQGLLHVPGTPSIKEINPVSICCPVISGQHQDQIDSDLEWQSHGRPGLPGTGLVKSQSSGIP